MSQFLHGEQGALICTAKIVETVPWIDAKYYAATQVMDEARHVEVFARYLDEKLGGHYPVNPALKLLLDDILGDSRWDITYLGMQIMVEGLALAAFGFMHMVTDGAAAQEAAPLRHGRRGAPRRVRRALAPGVLQRPHRRRAARAAGVRVRGRATACAPVHACTRCGRRWVSTGGRSPRCLLEIRAGCAQPVPAALFSKIVPNCKKLGLLDAGDGWLRERFTEIGVIQFEDWVDTGEEYDALDEVAKDRAAG